MITVRKLIDSWRHTAPSSRDLLISCGLVALVYLVAWEWNLSERMTEFSKHYEFIQLDEFPLALFTAVVALAWFSHRRMRELLSEVERRTRAEHDLSLLLAENRALAEHARQIQEEERRRIACEIHDEMGQYLTAIRLSAATLLRDSNSVAAEYAKRIEEHASHVQTSIKTLLHQLRPVALDEYGLIDAVRHLAQDWMKQNPQTHCHLALDDNCRNLQDKINTAAYRIVQEALTNVARHAQAQRVDIAIRQYLHSGQQQLLVEIRDNGIGFERLPRQACFGLAGMRERVEALGGSFNLTSGFDAGVQVSVLIPLEKAI